jgi:hypothetical protein
VKQIRATGAQVAKRKEENSGTYWDKKTGVLESNFPAKTNPVTKVQIKRMHVGRVQLLEKKGKGKKGLNISLRRLGTPRDTTTRRRGTGVPLGCVA